MKSTAEKLTRALAAKESGDLVPLLRLSIQQAKRKRRQMKGSVQVYQKTLARVCN